MHAAVVTEFGSANVLGLREVADPVPGPSEVAIAVEAAGPTFAGSLRAVGREGTVITLANVALAPSTIDTRDFYPRNVHIHGFQITDLMQHGYDPRPELRELLGALQASRFAVPIDTTFELADAAAAHRRLESRAACGKVILTAGTG